MSKSVGFVVRGIRGIVLGELKRKSGLTPRLNLLRRNTTPITTRLMLGRKSQAMYRWVRASSRDI